MSDVQNNPDNYMIVISDSATAEVIAVAGEFAGTFGIIKDVGLFSEVTGLGSFIYFSVEPSLVEDYQIAVSQNGNILAIVARDNILLDEASKRLKDFGSEANFNEIGLKYNTSVVSVLSCNDGTEIGDCSIDKPNVCEITNIGRRGLDVGFNSNCGLCGCAKGFECGFDNSCVLPKPLGPFADVSVNAPISLVEGEIGEVIISVIPNKRVSGMTIGVDVSDQEGILFSEASPSASITFDDQIVWVGSSSKISSEGISVEYRFKVKSERVGELTIAGRASAEGLSNDESVSFRISMNIEAAPCVESWSCGEFSPASCPVSGERTRVCSDVNVCGTQNDKPVEREACVFQPRCVESGDADLDIFTPGSVSLEGDILSDSCAAGFAREYACDADDNRVEDSFRCDVCNIGGTACISVRSCELGETQDHSCPDGNVINDYFVCNLNGDGYVDNPRVELECPSEQSPMNDLFNSLMSDSAVSPVGIVGSVASRTDNQGMIGIAGRFGISDVRLDTEGSIENIGRSVILVGGPCVNSAVADLQSQGKFPFACSGVKGWPGGGNFKLVHHVKDAFGSGSDAIVVAGTRAEDTLALARQVRDFSSNSGLFGGIGMACENVDGAVCTSIVQN